MKTMRCFLMLSLFFAAIGCSHLKETNKETFGSTIKNISGVEADQLVEIELVDHHIFEGKNIQFKMCNYSVDQDKIDYSNCLVLWVGVNGEENQAYLSTIASISFIDDQRGLVDGGIAGIAGGFVLGSIVGIPMASNNSSSSTGFTPLGDQSNKPYFEKISTLGSILFIGLPVGISTGLIWGYNRGSLITYKFNNTANDQQNRRYTLHNPKIVSEDFWQFKINWLGRDYIFPKDSVKLIRHENSTIMEIDATAFNTKLR